MLRRLSYAILFMSVASSSFVGCNKSSPAPTGSASSAQGAESANQGSETKSSPALQKESYGSGSR